MSAIDKRHLKTAQNILNQAQNSVADTPTNRELAQLANIGSVKGKRIAISLDDRIRLEKFLNKQLGQPIRELSLQAADRLLAAQQSNNEKLAKGTVFDSLINLAQSEKPLPIRNEFALYTAPNLVMSAPLAQIDADAIEQVVVVENGQMLTHWQQLLPQLPSNFQQALIVYKGHGSNQQQVQTLLRDTSSTCQIALFFDFDPAGLKMALELCATLPQHKVHLVLPADISSDNTVLEQLQQLNKPDAYHQQHAQLKWLVQWLEQHTADANSLPDSLQDSLPDSLQEIVQRMQQYQLAVTQEHLIAHKVALDMLSVSALTN